MGNIMVSLRDSDESFLRLLAQQKYGGKKGSISAVVKDALDEMKESKKNNSCESFLLFLSKGVKGSYKMYSKRSDIYD
ncbi:MAG: hypothetical protein COT55_00630 [Candidatus Diapherotrites archaeon CG09_land_8_20_14_0_10_32_12]|nr:MAG: hypothetical protein COT55_00630 [Candidatus Diapherotrites archaeon CG09_land_8_20_14_0_10_32_12]